MAVDTAKIIGRVGFMAAGEDGSLIFFLDMLSLQSPLDTRRDGHGRVWKVLECQMGEEALLPCAHSFRKGDDGFPLLKFFNDSPGPAPFTAPFAAPFAAPSVRLSFSTTQKN